MAITTPEYWKENNLKYQGLYIGAIEAIRKQLKKDRKAHGDYRILFSRVLADLIADAKHIDNIPGLENKHSALQSLVSATFKLKIQTNRYKTSITPEQRNELSHILRDWKKNNVYVQAPERKPAPAPELTHNMKLVKVIRNIEILENTPADLVLQVSSETGICLNVFTRVSGNDIIIGGKTLLVDFYDIDLMIRLTDKMIEISKRG